MRLPQRSLFALLLAVGVATCSEFHASPLEPAPGRGQVSFTARFSPEAAAEAEAAVLDRVMAALEPFLGRALAGAAA